MENKKQFEQLIMQYKQLLNGSEDIKKMLDREDYDGAMTMLKLREQVFLNCKCMRKYLVLDENQKTELNALLNELKKSEQENISKLEEVMKDTKMELQKVRKNIKIQNAYDSMSQSGGTIINYSE